MGEWGRRRTIEESPPGLVAQPEPGYRCHGRALRLFERRGDSAGRMKKVRKEDIEDRYFDVRRTGH